jgi:hypothetical protein
MMRDDPVRRLPMALSALVALALSVMPLPAPIDAFRPDFLVLVVFYWSIESPRAGGLALAFFSGRRARTTRPGADADGGLGDEFAAPAPGILGRIAVADHFCFADGLSVRAVLGGRRDGQPGDDVRPVARSGDRRFDLAVVGRPHEPRGRSLNSRSTV